MADSFEGAVLLGREVAGHSVAQQLMVTRVRLQEGAKVTVTMSLLISCAGLSGIHLNRVDSAGLEWCQPNLGETCATSRSQSELVGLFSLIVKVRKPCNIPKHPYRF